MPSFPPSTRQRWMSSLSLSSLENFHCRRYFWMTVQRGAPFWPEACHPSTHVPSHDQVRLLTGSGCLPSRVGSCLLLRASFLRMQLHEAPTCGSCGGLITHPLEGGSRPRSCEKDIEEHPPDVSADDCVHSPERVALCVVGNNPGTCVGTSKWQARFPLADFLLRAFCHRAALKPAEGQGPRPWEVQDSRARRPGDAGRAICAPGFYRAEGWLRTGHGGSSHIYRNCGRRYLHGLPLSLMLACARCMLRVRVMNTTHSFPYLWNCQEAVSLLQVVSFVGVDQSWTRARRG